MTDKGKARHFQNLFETRQDVYAIQFEKDEGGAGYFPARTKDGKYRPPTLSTYQTHLTGQETVGVYLPIPQEKDPPVTPLLCLDLDRAKFLTAKEMNASLSQLVKCCSINEIPLYVEVSRSGEGYHFWIFLEDPTEAWKIRRVAGKLLETARVEKAKCEIFPKQDWLRQPGDSLGNLVALPLDGKLVRKQRTVFIDPCSLTPLDDQWDLLKSIVRLDNKTLSRLIEEWEIDLTLPTKTEYHPSQQDDLVNLLPCARRIAEGVAEGSRDVAIFTLAKHLRKKGLPESMVLAILRDVNERNSPPLAESVIQEKVRSAFEGEYSSLGCDEPLIAQFCDKETCPVVKKRRSEEARKQNLEVLADMGIGERKDRPITARELLEASRLETPYLIGRGLLPKQGYTMLVGKAKEGKTMLALYFALCLAEGIPVFARKSQREGFFPVPHKARTLFLFRENAESTIREIIMRQKQGLERLLGRTISDETLELITLLRPKSVFLDVKKGQAELERIIANNPADIVVVDPLSRFIAKDMNKMENVTGVANFLDSLSEKYSCAFLLLHHFRKLAGGERPDEDPFERITGSAGWRNCLVSGIAMERKSKRRGSTLKRLSFEFRSEESPDPITLERDSETLLFEPRTEEEAREGVSSSGKLAALVKKEFPGGARHGEIAEVACRHFEVSKRRISELLHDGIEEGLIVKGKEKLGKYFVVDQEKLPLEER